jgi:hypothetical protein
VTVAVESTDRVEAAKARLRELGCRGSGSNWTCPVSEHDDRNPSLSVNPAAKYPGAVEIHCHVCDANQEPGECSRALEPMRWTARDLFPRDPDYSLQGQGGSITPHVLPSPCPCNGSEKQERPELYELIDAYERGEIEPEEVTLGELPRRANENDRRVADDLRFLIGLRRADGDFRPIPYATRFCAERMGWGESGHVLASRVLRRLERWDVIDRTATMPPRAGVQYRTKCYEPPLRGVEPSAVEPEPVPVEVAEVEPAAVVPDEPGVDRAEPTRRKDAGVVAVGDGAHTRNGPVSGGASATLDVAHTPNASATGGAGLGEPDPITAKYGPPGRNDKGEEMLF